MAKQTTAQRATRNTKTGSKTAKGMPAQQPDNALRILGGQFGETFVLVGNAQTAMNDLAVKTREALGERKLKTFLAQAKVEGFHAAESVESLLANMEAMEAGRAAVRAGLVQDGPTDFNPAALASEPGFLAYFTAHLLNNGRKPATVQQYYTRIAKVVNDAEGVFKFAETARREAQADNDGNKTGVTVAFSSTGRLNLTVAPTADMVDIRSALGVLNSKADDKVAAFRKAQPTLYGLLKDIATGAA